MFKRFIQYILSILRVIKEGKSKKNKNNGNSRRILTLGANFFKSIIHSMKSISYQLGMSPSQDLERLIRQNYTLVVILAVIFIAVSSLPYIYAHIRFCPGWDFMGLIGRDLHGGNMYFMYARQSKDGFNLFQNQLTPELLPRTFFDLEWWLFGRFARWFGLSLIVVFHIDRVLTVLFFFVAAFFLIAQCLPGRRERIFALILMIFGAGLGWLPWSAAKLMGEPPPFLRDIDGVTIFGYLINKPHFIRVAGLIALSYAFLLVGNRTKQMRYYVYSGLCAFCHASIRPYGIPEFYGVCAVMPVLLSFKKGEWSFSTFLPYGVAAAVPLPMVAYYAYLWYAAPLGVLEIELRPLYFIDYFFWAGVALVVIFFRFESFVHLSQKSVPTLLLTLWFLTAFLIAQSYPYYKSGEEGFFAMVLVPAILATSGPLRKLALSKRRTLVIAFLFFCSISSVIVYGKMFTQLKGCPPPTTYLQM